MREILRFILNGTTVELPSFEPTATLLDYIRETARRTGTKEGCNEGDCGACTVVLASLRDGALHLDPANSCITLLGMVDGKAIITVEDLANGGALHPVQSAMADLHASQCGFCTPGIVMSLFALMRSGDRKALTRDKVNDWLAGNLCRCTGYRPIVDAALRASELGPSAEEDAWLDGITTGLRALQDDADLQVPAGSGFFAAPASVEELASLYEAHPDATLLAGATDVGLWVTKRLADLPKIIYLGRVVGLASVVEEADRIVIGAMATYEATEAAMAAIDPDLGELWRRIGSKQIRASGTVGGNIANGSPIGDTPPPLIALGATITLQKGQSERTIPLEDYFLDYGKQDRAPGEFVRSISVPRLGETQHLRIFKVSKRRDEDITATLGAFRFTLEDSVITDARICYGGMAATPKRATLCEAVVVGMTPDEAADSHAVAEALAADFEPLSDVRASAEYRKRASYGVLQKALLEVSGQNEPLRIIPRALEAADA